MFLIDLINHLMVNTDWLDDGTASRIIVEKINEFIYI